MYKASAGVLLPTSIIGSLPRPAWHTARFRDMTETESAPLLDFLFAHHIRPEFTCRFRREAGSLALWDNSCAQHNPINDHHGFRRVMHRVTLAGDRPR